MTGTVRRDRRDSLVRLLFSQVAAVLAVTVLLVAMFAWLGPDRRRDGPARTASSATAQPSTRSPSSSPAAPSTPSSSPASTPPASTTRAPADQPQVVVLNQSGRAGLAAAVANRLRSAGWTVTKVGNFSGTVSTTTVYYPSGQQDAGQRLADDLPGTPRVSKRFSNLSETRVTVVLTSDYAG